MDVPFESTDAIEAAAAAAASEQQDREKSVLEASVRHVTEYVSATPVDESSLERPPATIKRTEASIMKPSERLDGRNLVTVTVPPIACDGAVSFASRTGNDNARQRQRREADDLGVVEGTEHGFIDLTASDDDDDSLNNAHASSTIMKGEICKKENVEAILLATTSRNDFSAGHHEHGDAAFENTKDLISAAANFSNMDDLTRWLRLSNNPDDVSSNTSEAENLHRLQKLDRRAMLQSIHKELMPPKPSTLLDFLAAQPITTTTRRRSSSRNVPAKNYFKDEAAWVDKDNWDNKVPGKKVTATKGGEPSTGRQRGRSPHKVADKGNGEGVMEAAGKDTTATQSPKRNNSVRSKAVQPAKSSTFQESLTRPIAAKQGGLPSKAVTKDNLKNVANHMEAEKAIGAIKEKDGEPKGLLCRRFPRKSVPNNFISNGWIDEASWENLLEVAWNDTVATKTSTTNSARTRKSQPPKLHRKSIAQPIPEVTKQRTVPTHLLTEKGDGALTETTDDHVVAAKHRTTTGEPTVRNHENSSQKVAPYDLSQSRCRVEGNVKEVVETAGNGATSKALKMNNLTKQVPDKRRRHSAPSSSIEQKQDAITEMPKQAPAPYSLFSQDYRPVFAAKNLDLSHVQIMAAVAKKWVDLSTDEKKPYRDRAAAAESKFKPEMKAWNAFQRAQEKLGRLPATSMKKNAIGDFALKAELKAKPAKEKDTTTTKISKPNRQSSLPLEPMIQKPDNAMPQSHGRVRDRCVGDGVLAMLPAEEDAGVPPPQRARSVSARCRMDRGHPRAKSLPVGMELIRDSLYSTSAPPDEDKPKPRKQGNLNSASTAETRKGNVRSTWAPPDEVAPAPTIVRPAAISKDCRPMAAHNEKSTDIAISRVQTGGKTQHRVSEPSADVELFKPTTSHPIQSSKKKRHRPDATDIVEVQRGVTTHVLSSVPPEMKESAQSRAFPLAFPEIKRRRTSCCQEQVATYVRDTQLGTSSCNASAPPDADESATISTVRFTNSNDNIRLRKTGSHTKGAPNMAVSHTLGGGETCEQIRISTPATFDLRGNHRSRNYIPNGDILGPGNISGNEQTNSRNSETNDEQRIDGSVNSKSHQVAGFSAESSPRLSEKKSGRGNLSGDERSLSQIFAEDDKQRFNGIADDKSRHVEGFSTNTSRVANSSRQQQQKGLNSERFLLLSSLRPRQNVDGTFGPHHVAATAARYEWDPIRGYRFVVSEDAFNNRVTLSRALHPSAGDDSSGDKANSGPVAMTPVRTAKAIFNMSGIQNKSRRNKKQSPNKETLLKKKSTSPKSSSALRKELHGLLTSNKLLKSKVAVKSNRGAYLLQPGAYPSSDGLPQKRHNETEVNVSLYHPNHVRLEPQRHTDQKANARDKAPATVARGRAHGTPNDSARHIHRVRGKDIDKRKSSTLGITKSARKKATTGGRRNFTDEKFLVQSSDPEMACGGSDVHAPSQTKKLYSRDPSRGQSAPLAVGDTQCPKMAKVKVTTTEPRFVACGGCVGCKMKTNCGSCLQCVLQCDAPPGTQLFCMQRICSAPTPNPKLLANQCYVAPNAPSPSKAARKGMVVRKRSEQSAPTRNDRHPSPLKTNRNAQSSGQAYTLTKKSKLTVHARSLGTNDRITPKKQSGYDIQASVLTESAESTTQEISILQSRRRTGPSATAHTNHRKRVEDDDSVLESLCDADSFVDDVLSDLDDDSSKEAARKSDVHRHMQKQVELSAADMARQWRAEIRGAHTFHPTDFLYDDESYCVDE